MAEKNEKIKKALDIEELLSYHLMSDTVPAEVHIYKKKDDYIPKYEITSFKIDAATNAVIDYVRSELVKKVKISMSEMLDPKSMDAIKDRFTNEALIAVSNQLPGISEAQKRSLAGRLVHNMLGLGELELMLSDPYLEEIVINGAGVPVWVYHQKIGWLESNITIQSDEQIYNYASVIGRKVGRQITNLAPLMDAHLMTGDRVNATLFPISTCGNTITIRKFARDPWTIVHMLDPELNTLSKEVASFLWLAIEYELSVLVAGGTASGKTSLLNALMPFLPTNHRVISIEDTRELLLPKYLHWVPLTTREPNPEGKGEVTMLDLLVNSLRMRPDRVIVGEIRRQNEAEVLFEAMHTGHSVYATLHADRAEQVKRRLTTPPIDLPEELLEALHLIIVQFRHRKMKIRRTFEVAEVVPSVAPDGKVSINLGLLYRWKPKTDTLDKAWRSVRVYDEIAMHTGMSDKEIEEDLIEKQNVLQWMLNNNIKTVNTVGKVIAEYYNNKPDVANIALKNKDPSELLDEALLMELKKHG